MDDQVFLKPRRLPSRGFGDATDALALDADFQRRRVASPQAHRDSRRRVSRVNEDEEETRGHREEKEGEEETAMEVEERKVPR